jgi:hypothetical protein
MTVVAQRVATVAQHTCRVALAVELGIAICRRFVRLVAAVLAFEVAAIATVIAVLGTEAFVACPSINECAVHNEVLAREQVLFAGHLQNLVE